MIIRSCFVIACQQKFTELFIPHRHISGFTCNAFSKTVRILEFAFMLFCSISKFEKLGLIFCRDKNSRFFYSKFADNAQSVNRSSHDSFPLFCLLDEMNFRGHFPACQQGKANYFDRWPSAQLHIARMQQKAPAAFYVANRGVHGFTGIITTSPF